MHAVPQPAPGSRSCPSPGSIDDKTRLIARSYSLSTLLALAALFLPLAAVAGWILTLPALMRIYIGLPAMQPNTAFGLVLGAIAALLIRGDRKSASRTFAICFLAAAVLLLGALTSCEYIFGKDLGIDRLFIHRPFPPDNPYPGRPSPQTAVNFILLGVSLALFRVARAPVYLGQAIALIMAANTLLAVTGYIFGASELYGLPFNPPSAVHKAFPIGIAVHTAIAFICLAAALLCSRPDEGAMSLMTSDTQSGGMTRKIALTVILGPPLVGALTRAGVVAGWHDVEVQAALFSTLFAIVLLWQTWRAARHGERGELRAREASAAEKEARVAFESLAMHFQTLLDQAPDGIFLADSDGRYTDVNSAACLMLGYSRDEILHMTVADLTLPEDAERLAQARERQLRGEIEAGEWRLRKKDGTRLLTEIRAKILPDGRWQAFVRDITERKRIEGELRFSEAKFSGIVSISADAIIFIDARQNITLFNAGAEKIFGYTQGEMIGAPLDILIPERYRSHHRQQVAAFAAGPDMSRLMQSRDHAISGRRRNGEEFPAAAAISKLTVGDKVVLGVTLRDITDQKRVENEQRFLSEVGAALAATLDYEETMKNVAALAVRDIADYCIVDLVGVEGMPYRFKVTGRDPSRADVCAALGQASLEVGRPFLSAETFRTKKTVFLQSFAPDQLTSFAQSDAHLAALRKADPRSLISLPLLAHNTMLGALTLLSSSRTYGDDDVRLAGELAFRASLAIENARLYRAAQRAIRTREDVLAIVSHDLRNPLSAIAGAGQLLGAEDAPKPGNMTQLAGTILRAAGQMRRLIDDLLDFAKIESGTLSVVRKPENPLSVITAAVEGMKFQAQARRQKLETDVPADLPPMSCDALRIGQVLSNLLGNAIKFTPAEGTVRVSARLSGDAVEISVSDTGPGIAPDDLPKVFDRYWQPEKTRTMGAGLGLAIARGLVETHGGKIWAESDIGKGAAFRFTIPLAAAAPSQKRVPLPIVIPSAAARPLEGIQVMVVDDSGDTRFLMNRSLTKAGANVIACGTVDAAMSQLRQAKPDVILTDIEMPEKSGFDMMDEIRHLSPGEGRDTPIAAITGHVGVRERQKIEAAGFDMCISKDDLNEVVSAVARLAATKPQLLH